jgi:hypothetical protein
VLENVLYARPYTSEHQYELLDYVAAKFHEEAGVFKLIVRCEVTTHCIQVLNTYILYTVLGFPGIPCVWMNYLSVLSCLGDS